jgi:hypothetical protein
MSTRYEYIVVNLVRIGNTSSLYEYIISSKSKDGNINTVNENIYIHGRGKQLKLKSHQ